MTNVWPLACVSAPVPLHDADEGKLASAHVTRHLGAVVTVVAHVSLKAVVRSKTTTAYTTRRLLRILGVCVHVSLEAARLAKCLATSRTDKRSLAAVRH